MKTLGWQVTRTEYGARSRVYGWRHEAPGHPAYTLRISRKVLEIYPAFVVLYHLDRLRVSAAMRKNPAARLVVRQKAAAVVLEEVPAD
jgi:hypothetical protein